MGSPAMQWLDPGTARPLRGTSSAEDAGGHCRTPASRCGTNFFCYANTAGGKGRPAGSGQPSSIGSSPGFSFSTEPDIDSPNRYWNSTLAYFYTWHSRSSSANAPLSTHGTVNLDPKQNPYQRNTAMSLRPLHDRVIVKRIEQETQTSSGIVLPGNAAEKPDQGEVLAVGPGKRDTDGKRIEPDLKVGERVLFGKYAGQSVKVDGDELLVLREEDVVAVVG
jgi:chaperonin GroES